MVAPCAGMFSAPPMCRRYQVRRKPPRRNLTTAYSGRETPFSRASSCASSFVTERDPRRSGARGRRAPGPSSAVTWRSSPRTTTTGWRESFARTRSAAAATSSATAIQVARSSIPALSVRPRQSSRAASPAQPIATSHWPWRHARPKLSVTTTATVTSATSRTRARSLRAEASGSVGSRTSESGSGALEASTPAFAHTNPWSSGRSAPRAPRGAPPPTRRGRPAPPAGPCRAARRARVPVHRARRRRATPHDPPPSRRPCARRRSRRPSAAPPPRRRERRGLRRRATSGRPSIGHAARPINPARREGCGPAPRWCGARGLATR